ncbi:hypothetical protein JCGZ_24707 [Jatropha curcas]|uniref:MYB family protein n=2 Tax=Jatropha curcas TaxID=180498 RepID=A0A067L0J8_JATCU|nr:MYB family protein [Jatropha curcas]KDP40708.1 hypothetical protein JCGZ_24707 [Jatropha curcas]
MGRCPCCPKEGLNRGAWTAMEDKILTDYIQIQGEGKWRNLPKKAGLNRCGKSCRLRWLNYLRPGIKRGNITDDEEELIIRLHKLLGNRWSLIAGRLPGRTDNEIKNYWNTTICKKLQPLNPTVNKSLSTLNTEPNKVFWTKASRCTKVVIPNNPKPQNINQPEMGNISGDDNENFHFILEENYNNSSDSFLDFEMDECLLSELLDTDSFNWIEDHQVLLERREERI